MRKPIIIEINVTDEIWPTEKINSVIGKLHEYLHDFIPEKPSYSKHAILGPAGKLLGIIAASKFGDNMDSYVGYISNIHNQQSTKSLSKDGMNSLMTSVSLLIELKRSCSERQFLKILSSVDYGVYYKKIKEIAERVEAKKGGSVQ